MKYNREMFNKKQKELLEKIEILKKYYSKDVIDYLVDLINLNECILKDKTFLDEFGSMDFVYELMKFNLIGRIYKCIEKESSFDQDRFISTEYYDKPIIDYVREDNRSFDVVECDFRRRLAFDAEKDLKPNVVLKLVTDRQEERLEDLESQFLSKNSKRDFLIESIALLESSKPKTTNIFHKTSNNSQILELKKSIEELDDEIKKIRERQITEEKYGSVESDICNRVTELVLEDYGLKDEEFEKTVNKSIVKKYKYIDIIKRLR